jgi:hypothetical protein
MIYNLFQKLLNSPTFKLLAIYIMTIIMIIVMNDAK